MGTDAARLIVVLAVLAAAVLVSLHDRHYSQRRLMILEGRIRTVERILTEDELT